MSNFSRPMPVSNVRFSKSYFALPEHSNMIAEPLHITTMNAGDIVPIYCREILPDESLGLSLKFNIRQTTLLTPTMSTAKVTFVSFFVPNRVVNKSWKAVMGENYSGSWVAPEVSLAPLMMPVAQNNAGFQIPVQSVADYYGFPTQAPININSVLARCHDLKFRGYVMIYNEFFRDQNYQPPVPLPLINVYEGFFHEGSFSYDGNTPSSATEFAAGEYGTGAFGAGAIAHAIYGAGAAEDYDGAIPPIGPSAGGSASDVAPDNRATAGYLFKAYYKPFKANKLHDYFTSCLPSPQKTRGPVVTPVSGSVNIPSLNVTATTLSHSVEPTASLRFNAPSGMTPTTRRLIGVQGRLQGDAEGYIGETAAAGATFDSLRPNNLVTYASQALVDGLAVSINDLREAAAFQQYYEILALGGSRYREIIASFYGINIEDPFKDIPSCLSRVHRDLDLFQTAQTSGSTEGGTPQGNLAAFGYTQGSLNLFPKRKFLEHGYLHVMAIIRHRNIYGTLFDRDNFRLSGLDFYTPPLANLSNQPVYTREINPFRPTPANGNLNAYGYQEAWAEYRYEPDHVSGYMRPGIKDSLAVWNYADSYDSSIVSLNGTNLLSNSEEVINRTVAVTSDIAPQFKCEFLFIVDKDLPMPTESVPGMDII